MLHCSIADSDLCDCFSNVPENRNVLQRSPTQLTVDCNAPSITTTFAMCDNCFQLCRAFTLCQPGDVQADTEMEMY